MGFTCRNAIFLADLKAGFDIGVCHGWVQKRVVYHLGKVVEGDHESLWA